MYRAWVFWISGLGLGTNTKQSGLKTYPNFHMLPMVGAPPNTKEGPACTGSSLYQEEK